MFAVQHPKIKQINQVLIYDEDAAENSNVYHMRQPPMTPDPADALPDQNYNYWTEIPDPIILGRDDIERVSLAVGAGEVWFDCADYDTEVYEAEYISSLSIISDIVDRSYSPIGSMLCNTFFPSFLDDGNLNPASKLIKYRRDADDVFFHQDMTRQTSRFNFSFVEIYRGISGGALTGPIYRHSHPASFNLNICWTYKLK